MNNGVEQAVAIVAAGGCSDVTGSLRRKHRRRAHRDPAACTDTDAHADTHADTDTDSDSDSDADADSHADPHADADAYAYAYAYADTYADAYADTHADADADTNFGSPAAIQPDVPNPGLCRIGQLFGQFAGQSDSGGRDRHLQLRRDNANLHGGRGRQQPGFRAGQPPFQRSWPQHL